MRKNKHSPQQEGIEEKNIIETIGRIAKIGIWEYCPKDSIFTLSEECSQIFDFTAATKIGFHEFLEFFNKESSSIMGSAINISIEEKKSFIRDTEIRTPSGKTKGIRIQGEAIYNKTTGSPCLFGTIQDTSDFRLVDKVAQESELTLNQVEQITHIGHWSVNLVDGTFFHSDETKRIFGYEPAEYALSVEDAINAYHPNDREEVIRLFNRAVETGENYEFDLRIIQPAGDIRYVHSKGYTEKDKNENISRVYGVFQDVTEIQKSLKLIEQSQMLLKASLESQKDTILLSIDQDYCYLYFNKVHADTMKAVYHQDIQLGDNILEHITIESDREAARINYSRALQGESHSNIRMYGKGSQKSWFESFFNPIRNEKNEIIGATAMARDISSRKHAEETLQESHNRYQALFEQAGDGIALVDIGGKILSFNDTFAAMHGYSRQELDNISLEDMDVDGRIHFQDRINKILAKETISFEVEHYHKNGHPFPILVTANLITTGKYQFIIAIHRDLSVYKKIEENLQKTQKLESLGILAGGIAHDFNNLMTGIFCLIELASEEQDHTKSTKHLANALATIDRARALTQQLLTFAKGGAPIKKVEALFPFVEETVNFTLSGSHTSCHFVVPEELWTCNFDKNQIGQVLNNLILNAQQSMPAGGTITLTARNVTLEKQQHLPINSGDYVEISIKDSGIGIPQKYLSKIFDPFFTTKTKGQGLGLATSYSIVHRHGGYIDVASEPGKGSTFRVYLPALRKDEDSSPSHQVEPDHRGKGLFLVMDDEEVVRHVLKAILKLFGYSVHCSTNGQEAVDFFMSHAPEEGTIVGMIFDLTIPGGMGGVDAAKIIRKTNPDIPIFVASGYADDLVMKTPKEFGFTASIPKPFRKKELSKILNQFLGP